VYPAVIICRVFFVLIEGWIIINPESNICIYNNLQYESACYRKDAKMSFWNQLHWTTKAILILLAGMVAVVSVLTLIRVGVFPEGWSKTEYESPDLVVPTPGPGTPLVLRTTETDIFSGPGTQYETIGQLKENQSAQVAGISPDRLWWGIVVHSYDNGLGWVSTSSVTSENTEGVPIIASMGEGDSIQKASEGTPLVTANVDTAILGGPGDGYDSFGLLMAGQSAEIISLSSDNGWFVVRVPYVESGEGWVSADFVTVYNPEGIPIVEREIEPGGDEVPAEDTPRVRAISNVNVRSGPDVYYKKIGLLPAGDVAEVIGFSADRLWWAIKVPFAESGQGWVTVDYVESKNTGNVTEIEPQIISEQLVVPTPSLGEAILTAVARVNIRSGPGTSYEILGRLEASQTALILGITDDGEWWGIKVPSAENGIGWVSAIYVRAQNAEGVEVYK